MQKPIVSLIATCALSALVAPAAAQAPDRDNGRFPELIRQQFGAGVEPSNWFTADLNGDSRPDLVALVTVRGRASLARDVVIQNPWKPTRPASRLVTGTGVAILHGGSRGWDQPSPGSKLLMTDKAFFDTPIWTSGMGNAPFGSGKKGAVAGLPRSARGDTVRLGTEAGIDIHLFWDGRTYRLFAPNEEP